MQNGGVAPTPAASSSGSGNVQPDLQLPPADPNTTKEDRRGGTSRSPIRDGKSAKEEKGEGKKGKAAGKK